MPTPFDTDDIRARVDAFVADLCELIREAALDAVKEALGREVPSPAVRGRRTKARSGNSEPTPSKRTRRQAKAASTGRARRTAEDIEVVSNAVLAHVTANPGERLETIAAGLDTATKELKRPVQALMAAGMLRTEGQRRGTTYWATADGVEVAPAPRKGRKKLRGQMRDVEVE